MNEADFKIAAAIVKAGTEAGVPFGEIEGRVCTALPGITDKDLEAAFERAAGEFRAEADALFSEADELGRFQETRRNSDAEIDPLPPDLWADTGSTSRNTSRGLGLRRNHRPKPRRGIGNSSRR
jgi:hypothetical protein